MNSENTDNASRRALGKGLAALIPGATSAPQSTGLRNLPIERVQPNPKQPRKFFAPENLAELTESIKVRGILQPVVVRRKGDNYELVAGERRWRAATQAGLHEIPAIVKEFSDRDALQAALVENIQRQDLDPLEEAEAYHRLINDHTMTQEQVAAAVGKSRVAVTNSLRLLKLPKNIMDMLADGRLTAGHARALLMVENENQLNQLADQIVQGKMSVRAAESLAQKLRRKPAIIAAPQNISSRHVEERLQKALATKVNLKNNKGKGRIEIYFNSLAELDRILEVLVR